MANSAIVTCPKCNTRVLPKQDGTCPSCRALISSKVSDTGQRLGRTATAAPSEEGMPSRTHKIIEKRARNDGLQTRAPDDSGKPRIRLAIEGARGSYGISNVGVGDLLFVDCDVYFICYSTVTLTGRAGTLMSGLNAGLVGVIIGGLVYSKADKDSLEGATQSAASGRSLYYALSLDERVERTDKSFVIRNPASVAYDAQASSVTCTSRTGEETTLYVPQMSKAALAILREFPEGDESLYPQDDPYGLLSWSFSPRVLTERLAQGQIDAAFLDEVASHQLYMHSFYEWVRMMVSPEQQDALVENLRQTPERFRASMSLTVGDTQAHDSSTSKNTAKLGRLVGGVLIVFSLAFLSSKNYFGLAGLALLGLACIVYIPYFAKHALRGHERLKEAILDSVGQSKRS